MKFAAKEINAKGGIDGYKVEIVSKDNKGDQAADRQTTQELLDDGVKLMVLTTGATSVASGQLATQAGAIASVGANTAPDIVKSVGDRAFMIVYGDNAQAAGGAEYACDQGYKTAYLLGSQRDPVHEVHPAVLQGHVREGLRRPDRRRGLVQDRRRPTSTRRSRRSRARTRSPT